MIAKITMLVLGVGCLLRAGSVLAESRLNMWLQECSSSVMAEGPTCELVYTLQGPLEGQERLIALGLTWSSRESGLLWTAVRGVRPRSAGIVVDNRPVLFSFNCSEEYCFFDRSTSVILRRMRTGKSVLIRLTSFSWEQRDFPVALNGFAALYDSASLVLGSGPTGFPEGN